VGKLKTIYRIRAEIPARVVEESGLLSKAREIGLILESDDAGNVEGAWDASLLTLATVLKTLEEAGIEKPLIQRRVVTLTVATDVSKTTELVRILRGSGVSHVSQTEDVFSGENVLRCDVSCKETEQLLEKMCAFGISKVIATEAYEVV
jgi:hypothetical protein